MIILLVVFLGLAACVLVYFAPVIVASTVGNRRVATIFVFNLLLGWTGAGWIIAMAWAVLGPRRRPTP